MTQRQRIEFDVMSARSPKRGRPRMASSRYDRPSARPVGRVRNSTMPRMNAYAASSAAEMIFARDYD
ncbi:MAG: hypothetical protein QM803_05620 [Rhodocyclaceae bacterium]